jgi:hypothetical protein
MAFRLDAAVFLAAAGGTGSFTVSSAITGYQTPAAAGAVDARTYRYRAQSNDLSQWEIGTATASSSGTVFSRTVLASSTGGTVNFSSAPTVAITVIAADLGVYSDAALGQLPGTATNDDAGAGKIGEIIEYSLGSTSLTSGAAVANYANGAFSAGDWEIWGYILINAGGATSLTNYTFSVSATSATQDTSALDRYDRLRFSTGWPDPIISKTIGPHRRSLSGSTPLYLVGEATFSSVLSVTTKLRGRRVR